MTNGAGEQIRTADRSITNRVLYQLSYTGSLIGSRNAARPGEGDGATPQNRTGDTVIFSHVLYQLS
jgi:hypothetical protein